MKKRVLFIVAIFMVNLHATTITELFNKLEKQPSNKIDILNEHMAKSAGDKVNSNYYPKVDIFANYTHYNSPTNLLPVDPLAAGKLIQQHEPLPFANTIQRYGVKASMPIFVKELSDLSKKTEHLAKGAKLKKRLNLYKNEAVIVGANSGLEYIYHLKKALNATKKSILKIRSDIKVSIDSGRMPGIALDKIDEKLNQLEIAINNIEIKKTTLLSQIETITGVELEEKVPMQLISDIERNEIFAIKPLQEVINATQSDLKATQSKRYYPKVGFNVLWSENYAQNAVNTHNDVNKGYGYYQVGISMPLFDKTGDTDIELKQIEVMKNKMKLNKTEHELKTEAKSLLKQLELLERSKELRENNIEKKENLLAYAKVATKEGRMTQEDYLRYEDELLRAKSSYFEIISQKWQNIAKLAVIYGNDLRRIVK